MAALGESFILDPNVELNGILYQVYRKVSAGKPPEKYNNLIQRIIQLANRIDEENEEKMRKEKFCHLSSRIWSWIDYIVVGVFTVVPLAVQSTATILSTYYYADESDIPKVVPGMNYAATATMIMAAAILGLQTWLTNKREARSNEKRRLLEQSKQISLLFSTLKTFFENKEEGNLKEVCEKLQAVDTKIMPHVIKDGLVSIAIPLLPEGNSLRKKFQKVAKSSSSGSQSGQDEESLSSASNVEWKAAAFIQSEGISLDSDIEMQEKIGKELKGKKKKEIEDSSSSSKGSILEMDMADQATKKRKVTEGTSTAGGLTEKQIKKLQHRIEERLGYKPAGLHIEGNWYSVSEESDEEKG